MKTNLFITAALLSAFLVGCGQSENKQETAKAVEKIPVRVVRVAKKKLLIPIESQGKLTAGLESSLSFKISGVIDKVYVNEGQSVKKGQTLATLDMAEINAQVKQAQAAFDKAERDQARMKNLHQDKVITLEALQNSETAFEVANSNLEIANFNKRYAVITAPSAGHILSLKAEENEIVNPGTPVFEFANTQQLWMIKVGLVDREVVKILPGDSAVVYFDALPTTQFKAFVSLIPNAPNPINGTYEVEISLNDYDRRLRTGFYSKVKIYPSQTDEYSVVPLIALVEGDGRDGIIYSHSGDKAVRRKVHVEEFVGGELAISGDVDSLDYVITEGVEDLTSNSQIEIVQ